MEMSKVAGGRMPYSDPDPHTTFNIIPDLESGSSSMSGFDQLMECWSFFVQFNTTFQYVVYVCWHKHTVVSNLICFLL
jgi:hypothetical protein